MPKCRDCSHLIIERRAPVDIATCALNHWLTRGATQWVSVNTVRRNRLPVYHSGRVCKEVA